MLSTQRNKCETFKKIIITSENEVQDIAVRTLLEVSVTFLFYQNVFQQICIISLKICLINKKEWNGEMPLVL